MTQEEHDAFMEDCHAKMEASHQLMLRLQEIQRPLAQVVARRVRKIKRKLRRR